MPGHDARWRGWCRARRTGSGRRRGRLVAALSCQPRIASRPAYSPWLPALGCSETASKPVISPASASRSLEHSLVAGRLVGRGEGVQFAELGPGDRDHLGGGVQLHRAGAERDHRAVQRDVLACEPAQVAQHLGLAAVAVEHRVGQEAACCGASSVGDQRVVVGGVEQRRDAPASAPSSAPAGGAGRASVVVSSSDEAERGRASTKRRLMPASRRGNQQLVGAAGHRQGQRVEEGVVARPSMPTPRRAPARSAVRPWTRRGDAGQPLRPVPDGVHAGDHRQQHLGGADVAGRLVAADVLLAGLQRQAQGRLAAASTETPTSRPGMRALVGVLGGEEGGVRPAIAHRHAEALGRAAGRCRRPARRAGSAASAPARSAGDDGEAARAWTAAMAGRRSRIAAVAGRVLQQRAEHGLAVELGQGIARRPARCRAGSARVRSTASVCGCTSASTKNSGRTCCG